MNSRRIKQTAHAMALVALTCTPAFAAAPVRILAFGNSLMQGLGLPPGTELPAVLQAKLDGAGVRASVINAGVSGDTSADGLSRIEWSLADHPDAAIVELGSNDALRGIDPSETEKNIGAVLMKIQSAQVPVLLLGMKAPRNLGREYDTEFDSIYPKLAKRYHVMLYPLVLEGVALNRKLNLADGMHPNPAGVEVIANRLLPYVEKLIGETPARKVQK